MRNTKITILSCTLFCFFAISAQAQSITAAITGAIADSSSAAVPGALISVIDTDRNEVVRKLTSDANGNYSAPLLPIGTYSVSVEAKGFKTTTRTGIVLNVNANATVNFTLEVGQVNEQVTVESAPVAVELQSAAQSNVVSGTQIRELELSTRNFAQLVTLVPGVSTSNTDQMYVGISAPAGSTTSVSFSMNGNRVSSNYWMIDGADNVDHGANGNLLNYPSLDALSEFRVLRSSYSAEFGRSAGGQINVVTKSGTSQFHGDAYAFVRNDAFAANNFLNNANGVNVGPDGKARVPPLRYNDFGYTIGGPIYIPGHYNTEKNKTFFFFSEEFRRVITYSTVTATLASPAEKSGIFPHPVCLTVSGNTCTQMSNQIPSAMINPVASAYIKDIFAQAPNGAPGTNLDFPSFRNVFNARQELYKIDHVFGPKLTISGRYLTDTIPTIEPGGLFTGNSIPGVATTSTNSPGHSWVFRATASFTPSLINEAGYNYSYGAIISYPIGSDAASLSPDIKVSLPFPVTIGRVPSLSFSGGGSGISGHGPYFDYNRNHNFYDNVTKILGRHSLRFGFTQNYYNKAENNSGNNVGAFSFTGAVRPAGTSVFEQSWADFLLGRVASFTQLSKDITTDILARQTELYFQDDYRVSRNLSLNLGLRYSIFREPSDGAGQMTNFDPAVFNPARAPQINRSNGNLIANTGDPLNGIIVNGSGNPFGDKPANENSANVAPRIGLAWDPFGKGRTSIRAGYGIYYDSVLVGIYENNIYVNPPFVNSLTIPNTDLSNPAAGTPITLAPKTIHGTPVPYQTPYVQQWSFDIQHQASKDLVVDIGYFGSKGTHLLGIVDLNEPRPGAAIAAGLVPPGTVFTSANSPALNAVRPYAGYNSINSIETWFNSNYNSLQASMEKRFSGSSLLKASYTFSKNLTDNWSDRNNAPQNTYNFHDGEYGLAQYDRRHILIVNYVYQVPFFSNQQGLVGHLFGGWELSGITRFESGLPSTAFSSLGTDPAGLGLATGSSTASARPDWACNPNAGASQTQFQWFNTGCFVPVPAGQIRPGNAGVGTIRGPGYSGWDFSIFKNVNIRERAHLQIRGEFYNVFNHPSPAGFGSSIGSSTYGRVTSYHDPRIVQLGAKFYF